MSETVETQRMNKVEKKAEDKAQKKAEKKTQRLLQMLADEEAEWEAQAEGDEEGTEEDEPTRKTKAERKAEKAALKAQKASEREANKKARAEIKKQEEMQIKKDARPILIILGGSDFANCKPGVLVDRILKSIKGRITANPTMILRGRTADCFRINYDPTAADVTSIRRRVNKLLPTKDEHVSLERLLSPLVASNRAAFDEIKSKHLTTRKKLDNRSYRSFWIHHQQVYRALKPITWYRRADVIAGVVKMTRGRCEKVDPGSALPRKPTELVGLLQENEWKHVRDWSLHGEKTGLAAKVRECFNGPELRSEEYEDLIEKTLYEFKKANKSAIYGVDEETQED